jgi:probable selenium-dependent hydroxylase accessory protein YqeC
LFSEQFEFKLPALVNFVGGGGKTALILALLHETAAAGPVLYTTTTRIHPPHPAHGLAVLSCEDLQLLRALLIRAVRSCGEQPTMLTATRLEMAPGLLRGVPPDFASTLGPDLFALVLNEADGARSMSLKMPRSGEPVLMHGAGYLVPVIGLDCIGKPLGPETLFRWESAAPRHGLTAGQPLTPELAASLLLHPEGVCKDWSSGVRIIPFINKADTEADDYNARELAYALMNNHRFPVERVVWGSVERGRAACIRAHRQ